MSRKRSEKEGGYEAEHPMVRVEWEDSCGVRRWSGLDWVKGEGPMGECTSVGYLVRDDETCVTIVGSQDGQKEPNVDGTQIIPRSAVRKVERLRVAGEHKKK